MDEQVEGLEYLFRESGSGRCFAPEDLSDEGTNEIRRSRSGDGDARRSLHEAAYAAEAYPFHSNP